MARRPFVPLAPFGLAAALVFGLPALSGCANSGLVETAVPSDGLELRYALAAGQTFDGHIRRSEAIMMREQPMTRSIDFSVQLIVREIDESGTAKVAATVSNIKLNWAVPGMPISTAEFNRQVIARLEGVTIPFSVEATGRVFDVPPAPAGLEQSEVTVLDSIIEGLTSGFFVVPVERLGAGDTWEENDTRGREGKLGKYTSDIARGTLVGTYIRTDEETGFQQNLAKLKIDGDKNETTTTKDGSSAIRTRSDTEVFWDTKDSYLASIHKTMTRTQGPNTTTVKFDADWTQTIGGSSQGTGPAQPEPQEVMKSDTDPCGDDYVGPDECLDACSVNYMGEESCNDGSAVESEAAPSEAAPSEAAPSEDEAIPVEVKAE